MNNRFEIRSISDAIAFAGKQDGKCWFRGHADANWDLIPSVFRPVQSDSTRYYNESALLSEFVRRHPEAKEKHSNTFELLTYAQHYGLPTRLLDWTENLLVALFFATENDPEKDGELISFKLTPYSMENNLFYGKRLKEIIEHQVLNDYKVDDNCSIDDYICKIFNLLFHSVDKVREIKHPLKINNISLTPDLLYGDSETLEDFLESKNLRHPIEIRGTLYAKIPNSIRKRNLLQNLKLSNRVIRYHPPYLNARLIAQKGCFTIHTGKIINNEEAFKIERDLKSNDKMITTYTIPSESKEKIKAELKLCGITKSTLFPELEYQTVDIRNDCKY